MRRDLTSTVAVCVATALPVFLVGALAVQIESSLHFGPKTLGLVIALYWLGAAVGSVPCGRLAEKVGGLRVMKIATVLAAVLLAVMPIFSNSTWELGVLLFVGGIIGSAIMPATNLFLARRMPTSRQGVAFGIKQAAQPAATLLGGLAVPSLGVTVGWRWAFVAASLLSVVAAVTMPKPRTSLAAYRERTVVKDRGSSPRYLIVLTVGFALGISAAMSLNAFIVSSAVASGFSKVDAGLLAALAGATAIAVRIGSGFRADRRGRAHFAVVALLLALGAVGCGATAAGSAGGLRWLFVAGALLGFGAGWGWNGLFNFAVVRSHMEAPARATATTQVGGRLAAGIGPLVFGALVSQGSYTGAWLITAACAMAGAVTMLYGRHLLRQSLAASSPL